MAAKRGRGQPIAEKDDGAPGKRKAPEGISLSPDTTRKKPGPDVVASRSSGRLSHGAAAVAAAPRAQKGKGKGKGKGNTAGAAASQSQSPSHGDSAEVAPKVATEKLAVGIVAPALQPEPKSPESQQRLGADLTTAAVSQMAVGIVAPAQQPEPESPESQQRLGADLTTVTAAVSQMSKSLTGAQFLSLSEAGVLRAPPSVGQPLQVSTEHLVKFIQVPAEFGSTPPPELYLSRGISPQWLDSMQTNEMFDVFSPHHPITLAFLVDDHGAFVDADGRPIASAASVTFYVISGHHRAQLARIRHQQERRPGWDFVFCSASTVRRGEQYLLIAEGGRSNVAAAAVYVTNLGNQLESCRMYIRATLGTPNAVVIAQSPEMQSVTRPTDWSEFLANLHRALALPDNNGAKNLVGKLGRLLNLPDEAQTSIIAAYKHYVGYAKDVVMPWSKVLEPVVNAWAKKEISDKICSKLLAQVKDGEYVRTGGGVGSTATFAGTSFIKDLENATKRFRKHPNDTDGDDSSEESVSSESTSSSFSSDAEEGEEGEEGGGSGDKNSGKKGGKGKEAREVPLEDLILRATKDVTQSKNKYVWEGDLSKFLHGLRDAINRYHQAVKSLAAANLDGDAIDRDARAATKEKAKESVFGSRFPRTRPGDFFVLDYPTGSPTKKGAVGNSGTPASKQSYDFAPSPDCLQNDLNDLFVCLQPSACGLIYVPSPALLGKANRHLSRESIEKAVDTAGFLFCETLSWHPPNWPANLSELWGLQDQDPNACPVFLPRGFEILFVCKASAPSWVVRNSEGLQTLGAVGAVATAALQMRYPERFDDPVMPSLFNTFHCWDLPVWGSISEPWLNALTSQRNSYLEQFFIERTTIAGDLVLGLCAGSGTTGVAAKGAGCEFIGVEIDDSLVRGAEVRIKAAKARKLPAVRTKPQALAAAVTEKVYVSPKRSAKSPAAT